MKKHILLLVTLVFAATAWTQAQTVLDFKLVNNTGEDFYAVYLTDTGTQDWGEDILPQDIVRDGAIVDITFEYVDDDPYVGEDPVDSITDKINQKLDAKDKVNPVMATANEDKEKEKDDPKVEEDLEGAIAYKFNEKVVYILLKYIYSLIQFFMK